MSEKEKNDKRLKSIQEQLPRRGIIIVENKANKENVPELLVLISVTDVSSGASIRHQIQEAKR
ncbi:MAG: hypothetical protein KAX05_08720 [Bacteroidales bacterium]|nr:hypothetical protein [Bacteroidales bacterium]